MKARVHELAKKYEIGNKEFLAVLNELGIEAKSHLSALEADDVNKVAKHFAKASKIDAVIEPKKEAKKTEKKVEKVEVAKETVEEKKHETHKEKNVVEATHEKKEEAKEIKEEKKHETKKIFEAPKKEHSHEALAPIKKTKKQIIEEEYEDELLDLEADEADISKDILIEATHSIGGNKKKKKKGRRNDFTVKKVEAIQDSVIEEDGMKIIKLAGDVTLGKFAELLKVKGSDLIKALFLKGQMLTINSVISFELAEEIALEYNAIVEKEEEVVLDFGDKFSLEVADKPSDLEDRAPVITIMGHVDHGKTSLLDAIRSANVVEGEHGGITQKIGAYQVVKDGKKITFIDTPGHEAFTDMRARGTQATDIAILVVAADDGVMPQTVEAIAHAKAAKVPIIVAVNKIDKEGANPAKVKQELMEHELVPVEWGGDVEYVEVSAKNKMNIDGLLETILLTAELLELKANYKKRAKGVILESKLDTKVGPVADLLIQEGHIKIGDVIVAGEAYGKVRSLINDKGIKVNRAEVSEPIEIIGFTSVPEAGDVLYVIQNEQHARRIVDEVAKERRISEMSRKALTLESLSAQFEHQKIKELNLIIRADSRGSAEALRDSLMKLNTSEVAVNVIQLASGAITESDVKLAEASKAIILGFHVRPTTKAIKESTNAGVEIRTSNIIYQIIEDIEKALTGMLEPEYKEIYLGRIELKKVFKVSNVGNVAGCVVVDGKVKNTSNIRVLRDGVILYEGKLSSLKRFKDDVKEVVAGQECGLNVVDFDNIKEGDLIEAYEVQEIKRKLKDS